MLTKCAAYRASRASVVCAALMAAALLWASMLSASALAPRATGDMPREPLDVPTVATLPPTVDVPTATRTVTPSPTFTPTATRTATPTLCALRLPIVLKYAKGMMPTLRPTTTSTPTRTLTPSITPTSTPAIAQPYGSLTVEGAATDRPAAVHPDLNLAIRSYVPVGAGLYLIDLGGGTDPNAPNLHGLCASAAIPNVRSAYGVYDWDWRHDQRGGLITNPEVTLLGLTTHPGELVFVPPSGYDLGQGYDVLVLYATDDAITLKYTREDNVVWGYTIHIEGITVDPALLSLYTNLDHMGRGSLPALYGGQAFGWAAGVELRVAIRDTGSFMEPRSRKDWWR